MLAIYQFNYDAKILDIKNKVTNHDHYKYITTSEFHRLTTYRQDKIYNLYIYHYELFEINYQQDLIIKLT